MIISLQLNSEFGVVNPYISQLSPIFTEAVKGDYLIKRRDGSPWQFVSLFVLNLAQGLNLYKMGFMATRSSYS